MDNNKIKTLITTLVIICSTLSCKNGEEAGKQVASKFLESYFRAQYDTAASLCTPSLAEELKGSLKSLNSLDSSVQKLVYENAKNISFKITSMQKCPTQDSLIVEYLLLLPNISKEIENRMILTKEQKGWQVARLGN